MSTACSRTKCWGPATYVVRDNPRVHLCADHASRICETDVVCELPYAVLDAMVAA